MPAKRPVKKALTIFYSYAHEDEKYTQKLINHLSILRHSGLIKEWHDRKIMAGDDWEKAIHENLQKADIIILLVSADFLSSNYCWSVEMKAAMEKDRKGTARVIPVIVKPVLWQFPPLSKLQAFPKDGKPVVTWHPPDGAWETIAREIQNIYTNGIQKKKPDVKTGAAGFGLPVVQATKKSAVVVKSKNPARHLRGKRSIKAAGKIASVDYKELKRFIYDAQHSEKLPGKIVRSEGDADGGDTAVNETYEWLGVCYQFFREIYKRNSIDGKGLPLKATVHYGKKYENAFWITNQLVCGDGDGGLLKKLPFSVEMIGKQFSNGIVSSTKLAYWEQSGALFNSLSIIFACLIKQYYYQQKAEEADWLFGRGILKYGKPGDALYSLANPGTAYQNNKAVGSDPQPSHMSKYVVAKDDNGGIHVNSGISNRAFYLLAKALGGYAWDKAGRIWYDSLMDKNLKPNCQFADFAHLNVSVAGRLYGRSSKEVDAVKAGWRTVGIDIDGPHPSKKPGAEAEKPVPKNPRKIFKK